MSGLLKHPIGYLDLRIILNTVIHSNLEKNCVIYMTGKFIEALSIDRDDLTAAEMRMTRYFRVHSNKTDAGWFYTTVLLNNTLTVCQRFDFYEPLSVFPASPQRWHLFSCHPFIICAPGIPCR